MRGRLQRGARAVPAADVRVGATLEQRAHGLDRAAAAAAAAAASAAAAAAYQRAVLDRPVL